MRESKRGAERGSGGRVSERENGRKRECQRKRGQREIERLRERQ